MAEIALRLEGVSHVFHRDSPSEVRALDGVDLALERGTFTVVVGTNGSGKSSLLNAIAGSLGLTGGRVYLAGDEVTHWSEQRRARRISRVFQNPFTGTASDLSVAENLVLAGGRGGSRGLRRALGRERRRDVRDQVARLGLGLEDRLDTPIGLLSGGQRQALTLLMATMVKPSLLLLDEHTAALDPNAAAQVIDLTVKLAAERHLTVLMITHSMSQACQVGNGVVMMHQGQILFEVSGPDRRNLTVESLVERFKSLRAEESLTDRLLLD